CFRLIRLLRWRKVIAALLVVVVCHAPPSVRADDLNFEAAAQLYHRGKWRAASEAFQAYLSEPTQNPVSTERLEAEFYLAESLVQLGEYRAAHARFVRLADAALSSRMQARIQFRRGETAYFLKLDPEATRTLTHFVAQFPDDALVGYALPYLADLAKRAGAYQQAVTRYEAALAHGAPAASVEDCRFGWAECRYRLGEVAEARDEFARLSQEASPRVACGAHYALAMLEYHEGQHEAAVARFCEFREAFPQDARQPRAAYMQAISLFALEQFSEANQVFAVAEPLLASAQSSLEPDCWFFYAKSLQACEYHDQARWRYQRLIDQAPQHRLVDAARRELVTIAASTAESAEEPTSAEVIREADQLISQQRWGEALALIAERREPEAMLAASRCLLELGQLDEVRARLAMLFLDPACVSESRVRGQQLIVESYRRQDDFREAGRECLRLAANAPAPQVEREALEAASECWAALGRVEAAAQLEQRARSVVCVSKEMR
ncbi:MAG: tetratricopeptide repeat protein, partial [Planctomycetota bacterium]